MWLDHTVAAALFLRQPNRPNASRPVATIANHLPKRSKGKIALHQLPNTTAKSKCAVLGVAVEGISKDRQTACDF
jgi:hypothetical protein